MIHMFLAFIRYC